MSKAILYCDIHQLMTLKKAAGKQARRTEEKDLSIVKSAAMVVENGRILWAGRQTQLPAAYRRLKKVSLHGHNVFPGWVDCHTHLLFAGDRSEEFELRNQGVSYQEIANRGGGILSTMKATRRASLKSLVENGQQRVNNFIAQGGTTLEVKSGYGLNRKTEIKLLQAAAQLKKVRVQSTFLGAHAIPSEFAEEESYLQDLILQLQEIKKRGLAQRVDIFIEKGYFSRKRGRGYLLKAKEMGFDITIHADQLSRQGASALGVEVGARSVDHAIRLSDSDKTLLADSETTAVLLPAADFYIHCPYPDARGLLDRGARCALATDFNPGSSPTQNLALIGLLARLQMKMTLPEVFVAMTLAGAYALGREKDYGALCKGYSADFFSSPISWKNFFYNGQVTPVSGVWSRGVSTFRSNALFKA